MTTTTASTEISEKLNKIYLGLQEINLDLQDEVIADAQQKLEVIINELRAIEQNELIEEKKSNEVKIEFHRSPKNQKFNVKLAKHFKLEANETLKSKLSLFLPFFVLVGGMILFWVVFTQVL